MRASICCGMGGRAVALLGVFVSAFSAPAAAEELPWGDLKPTTVLSGLNGPIDFAIANDGSIWWNEYYTGNVTRYDPADGSRRVVFHADPIPEGVERGVVGLALDPDVVDNGVFYVYYTVADPNDADGGTNRLVRVEDGEETLLLSLSAAVRHNGGRILFAPDGSMFVSTGENLLGHPAQDPSSLLGKTLHLWPDGRPAPGNLEGFVYSIGHRNVYGLAYDPLTNRLFNTENGNAERDEVNLILAGGNYGWPHCEGFVEFDLDRGTDTDRPCTDPRFIPPIGEFYPNTTAAPTGAAVLGGVLYWASWNQGAIHRLVEAPGAKVWTDTIMYRPGGRINDMEAGPDGQSIYYSNWTHILRLDVPVTVAAEPVVGPGADKIPGAGVLCFAAAVVIAAVGTLRHRTGGRQ